MGLNEIIGATRAIEGSLLDCSGGQLDANTRISPGYAQNLPDH
jgi:hypothetical protein